MCETKFFRKTKFKNNGAIAQSVEQRTENPCVAGSIPAGTTLKSLVVNRLRGFFCFRPSETKV